MAGAWGYPNAPDQPKILTQIDRAGASVLFMATILGVNRKVPTDRGLMFGWQWSRLTASDPKRTANVVCLSLRK